MFQYCDNPKSVKVMDPDNTVLGEISLTWTDGGKLAFEGKSYEWEYTCFFEIVALDRFRRLRAS